MNADVRKGRVLSTPGASGRSTIGCLLLMFAAFALAGCTRNFPESQLPPPTGPLVHWHVHESSEAEGKITFRCNQTMSMNCSDDQDRLNALLHAAKMCRDWGYAGLKNAGPNLGWTVPMRDSVNARYQTTFRCRGPKTGQV